MEDEEYIVFVIWKPRALKDRLADKSLALLMASAVRGSRITDTVDTVGCMY